MRENPKEKREKSPKMTLKDYYMSLPEATHPKQAFINSVCAKTGVSEVTVRNWISYGMKPKNPEHAKILSLITGISIDDLWT